MMRGRIQGIIRRFLLSEGGGAIIEGVMMMPLMLAAWVGLYAFWEGYNARDSLEKATFATADILSREMVPVTGALLDGLDNGAEYLVGPRFDVTTRFTAFRRTGANDTDVAVVWSYAPGSLRPAMTTADLVAMAGRLPKLTTGSMAVISETQMAYSAPSSIPFVGYVVPSSFSEMVVLRPRFVPKLCWAGSAC